MPEPLPRVGHIDFLNVLPLAYGYAHGGADGLAIERGVPAVLNSDLIAGRLDVSNVSSILYARHADKLRILRGPCVSTDGAVESILLLSRKPIEEIEDDRIALTAKSATSHALLKIILRSGYGAVPTYNVQSLSVEHPIPEGKKMVYALWVASRRFAEQDAAALTRVSRAIRESFAYGLAHKDAAIRSVLGEKPFTYEELDHYLGGVIHWDLTEEYLDGLRTFYELAARTGLIEKAPELVFAGA